MDTITTFLDNITTYEIHFPLWFKTGFILLVILAFIVGGYMFYDTFDTTYTRDGFIWFIIIGVVNLLTILLIYFYYGRKPSDFIGPTGPRGKKGKRGKIGKSVSCNYCKSNIFIKSVRKTDTICALDTHFPSPSYKLMSENLAYFIKQTTDKEDINYSSFINNIILAKTSSSDNANIINKFRALLNPSVITIALLNAVNAHFATVANRKYGTIRSPVNKVGYVPLGDSAYGGTESFSLNSFVVSGDIMYPTGYKKLVSFSSYNETTNDNDIYTIWRAIPQIVNETTFEGDTVKRKYIPLGDVCRVGRDNNPALNDYAMIKETCLEPVKSTDLKMVFLYLGDIEFNQSNQSSQSSPNSYLIVDEMPNSLIEIFSVWRTPMNTFITNSNTDNPFINDTVYMNIFNNVEDVLNDAGYITNESKTYLRSRLKSITIPQIVAAIIYTAHFQRENTTELMYYMNRYQAQIPEFADITISEMSLAEMMDLIANVKLQYENWNADLIRNASVSLSGKKAVQYDASLERYLPAKLIQTYTNISNNLDTIPIMIENTSNLLDIINNIIPNGLDGRIAVDSTGIAEGGIMMNDIQEVVLRICKCIMPPENTGYMIKDECLGTFELDHKREELLKELTDLKDNYNKMIDIFASNYEIYKSQVINIRQIEEVGMRKMGQLCGHISDYMNKIHEMNLDEFSDSRLQGLINIYKEVNEQLQAIINSASD